jgi:hypothetical protein
MLRKYIYIYILFLLKNKISVTKRYSHKTCHMKGDIYDRWNWLSKSDFPFSNPLLLKVNGPRVMKKNTTQFFFSFNFFFNFKTVIKYCSVPMVYNLWIFISQSQIYIIHFFKLLLCYLIIWYFSEDCFIYSVTYVVLLITVSL